MDLEIENILAEFSKVKVLVVGDVMLDRYWWGSMTRISPEAPVPIVNLERETFVVGGAANVAANIKGLGAIPYLVGVIGDDQNGNVLKETLESVNIKSNSLVTISERPTTVKTRIIAHQQQIGRIDQESTQTLLPEEEELVWQKCLDLINGVDIVVVSDYLKGLLSETFLLRLIMTSNLSGKKILIDPKGKDYRKYKNATLLTPNRKEAFEASRKTDVKSAGETLISQLALESLLITEGEEGMTIFEKNVPPFQLNAMARHVYDVTGAGDTVIASLAVALAAGYNLKKAAEIANIAAGCVVEEVGTTSINFERLSREFV
jgi:D-beta-D-heptose 7-phosphate kinase/D-beta-D-heptose 1-phosphate adenosyltransferase